MKEVNKQFPGPLFQWPTMWQAQPIKAIELVQIIHILHVNAGIILQKHARAVETFNSSIPRSKEQLHHVEPDFLVLDMLFSSQ